MKRITIKDLSNHLLLSTSTILRAFTGDKNIHPETFKKVMVGAAELGYRPNLSALSLRYGQSKTIGLVVPEMITPFSSAVLHGIQHILSPKGYRFIILQSDKNHVIEKQNLLLVEKFNVDGIIVNLCDTNKNEDTFNALLKKGIQLVFFDRIPAASLAVSKVIVDDSIKASLMVEHLIEIGRKRIAHIMGPDSIRNASERASGYKSILTKYNVYDANLIIETMNTDFQSRKKAVQDLINKGVAFDAVFAFTDTLAIGAMNFLLEKNVKIPQEVAIAGFSGTELSTIVFPQLTTVKQPLVEMGETAAELLLQKNRDSAVSNKTIALTPNLMYRASTVTH